jgi:hypothetical protein
MTYFLPNNKELDFESSGQKTRNSSNISPKDVPISFRLLSSLIIFISFSIWFYLNLCLVKDFIKSDFLYLILFSSLISLIKFINIYYNSALS